MSRGYPSLTALLGILAVAGYQNRDKLAGMFGTNAAANSNAPLAHTQSGPTQGAAPAPNQGVTQLLAGLGGVGSLLGNGLNELVERFKTAGQAPVVDSWIKTGDNNPTSPVELERAIGPEVLDNLVSQTGLSRADIVQRLSRDLPDAVDRYTPDGKIPNVADRT